MLEKEFVPYEEALELKELGFNQYSCLGNYADDEKHTLFTNGNQPGEINAPTFSQAFKFFRENYKLHTYIDFYHSDSYFYKIKSQDGRYVGNTGYIVLHGIPLFTKTHEEAELACLKRLIQIVKEKQNG